jgi:hypothetical protein
MDRENKQDFSAALKNLCKQIEVALRHSMVTPKDFELLKEKIYMRQHVLVSRTTLMRIWGYLNESVQPRTSTLNILTQFLGYGGWNDYRQNALLNNIQQSSPVLNRRISVVSDLSQGEQLRLSWHPDRACDIKYMGNLTFIVVDSENTRLKTGDTFQCSIIIEGEPLYIDNLMQGDRQPIAYVCGKKSGVMFEYIR